MGFPVQPTYLEEREGWWQFNYSEDIPKHHAANEAIYTEGNWKNSASTSTGECNSSVTLTTPAVIHTNHTTHLPNLWNLQSLHPWSLCIFILLSWLHCTYQSSLSTMIFGFQGPFHHYVCRQHPLWCSLKGSKHTCVDECFMPFLKNHLEAWSSHLEKPPSKSSRNVSPM